MCPVCAYGSLCMSIAATRPLIPGEKSLDSEGGMIVSRCRFIFSWFALQQESAFSISRIIKVYTSTTPEPIDLW